MSGPTGTWRQLATVHTGWKALRRFLVFVGEEHPNVTTITDVTADVWKSWRENTDTASGLNGSSMKLRTLLREADGLPARTRMALNGRIEGTIERQMVAYKRGEMARIVRAARGVFRAAETRISANKEALDRYRAGMEPEDCVRVRFTDRVWSHGEVLDHLSLTGRMPDPFYGVPRERSGALREALGIGEEGQWYRISLFPAVHEVYAAMILLVPREGPQRLGDGPPQGQRHRAPPGAQARTLDLPGGRRQGPPRARQVLLDHVLGARGAAVAADVGHGRAGPRHPCRVRLCKKTLC